MFVYKVNNYKLEIYLIHSLHDINAITRSSVMISDATQNMISGIVILFTSCFIQTISRITAINAPIKQ